VSLHSPFRMVLLRTDALASNDMMLNASFNDEPSVY